jgi:streptogramin lyase
MARVLATVGVTVALATVPSALAGGIEGPTTIAVGFGSVWVGMGSGEVVRLDPQTRRETSRLPGAPTAFVHSLVAGNGAVWALRGRMTRIDPRTRAVREVRGVGSATGFTAAVSSGAIWMADDGNNAVVRIDPQRMRRAAVIRVPGRAFGLAAGGRHVFVVSVPGRGPVTGPGGARLLRRVDPETNTVSRPLARLNCDPGMAVAKDVLWTTNPCDGWLVRRDADTLSPTGRMRVPRWKAPVLGFGSVWLVGGNRLLRVDPERLRVVASIPVKGTTAAVGEAAVWVLSMGNGIRGSVRKVDPRTNRVVGRPISLAPKP